MNELLDRFAKEVQRVFPDARPTKDQELKGWVLVNAVPDFTYEPRGKKCLTAKRK